jgi:predicted MFS family arabinose efflux permease
VVVPIVASIAGWAWALRTSTLASIAAAVAFAVWYPRRPSGSPRGQHLDLGRLLRNRRFVLGTAFAVVAMGTLSTGTAYLTLDAHEVAGKTVVQAGAIYAFFQIGGAVGRLAWGAISDRLRRRELALGVLAVMGTLACLLVAAVRGPIATSVFAALAFFLGVSTNGFSGTYLTLITESVSLELSGAALGISLTIAEAGLFGIPPLFGILVATIGFSLAWTALAGWMFLATAIALLMAVAAPRATPGADPAG